MSVDPSNLTVERLKKELDKHEIPYRKTARKEDLVSIYRSHFGTKSGLSEHRLDDSYKSSSPRMADTEEALVSASGLNVSAMSDDEVISKLEERGADVGPITDTTRQVYKKKLLKMLNNERTKSWTPVRRREEEEEEEDEENNASDDASDRQSSHSYREDYTSSGDPNSRWAGRYSEVRYRETVRSDSPKLSSYAPRLGESTSKNQSTDVTRREYTSSSTSGTRISSSRLGTGDYSSSLSRPPLSGTTAGPVETKKKSLCPIWLQLLLLILLAAFLFLVLQNIDAGWPNPARLMLHWGGSDNTDKKKEV